MNNSLSVKKLSTLETQQKKRRNVDNILVNSASNLATRILWLAAIFSTGGMRGERFKTQDFLLKDAG